MAESTKHDSTPQTNGQANWVRAVDEELINAHLGTASAGESYETARRKLGELIEWNIKVATDPAVNGGFELTPVDQSAWLRGAEELCRVYFEIAAEAIGEDEVRARRDSRVADLPSARVRAKLAEANAARWSEFCRQVEEGQFPVALLQDAQQMGAGVLEQHIDEDLQSSEREPVDAAPLEKNRDRGDISAELDAVACADAGLKAFNAALSPAHKVPESMAYKLAMAEAFLAMASGRVAPIELTRFLQWAGDELVDRDNLPGNFAAGVRDALHGRAGIIRAASKREPEG